LNQTTRSGDVTSTLRQLLLVAGLAALLPAALLAQQPALITGHVTNSGGAPLSGAQVSLPSLGIGGTSRGNGSYTILLPAARIPNGPLTVTARLIGYKLASTEVSLTGGSATADFVLAEDPLRLTEVVVTGAGTATEVEKLGTVRNNIDSAAIVAANEQNLITALAAKAPNVSVFSSSSDPGASAYIQIRGLTSISSSDGQPLFVVDGLPVDNSTAFNNPAQIGANGMSMFPPNRLIDLNPDDIGAIEILKGPSSAALYGSRAGQGVVLITTKHARPGQTRYSLRTSWSLERHTQLPRLQRQFATGSGGVSPSCVPGPASPAPDLNQLNCPLAFEEAGSWGPPIPGGRPTYDHAAEIFQDGFTTDNAIDVSGGTETTQFFFSGGYSYNRGIVVGDNSHYRRISVRLNGSQQVTNRLKVGADIAYSSGSGGFVVSRNSRSGLTLASWRTPPDFDNLPYLDPVFGLQRSYRFPNPGPGSEQLDRGFDNPFFIANATPATSNVSRPFGVLHAEWNPTGWLKLNETLGLDYSNDERFQGWPWSSSDFLPPNGATGIGAVNAGYIRNTRVDHNLTGTFSYSLSPKLQGTVTLGHNLSSQSSQSRQTFGLGLITPEPFNLANTATILPPIYDFYQKVHLESYFGQVTVDLWDQLYLRGGLRNDGVSSFGLGSQQHWFPQASAAWVFHGGQGAKQGLVSYGKLRAAYGQSGTQPPPYLLSSFFLPAPSQLPGVGGFVTGGDLPNPKLGPERVKEFEAGVDLGLFGDKADLSLTHYRQNSADVILEIPVALSRGYGLQQANAGSLQNRGWELSLNLRPVNTHTFGWDVGIQWARNRGITTSLASGISYVQLPAAGGGGGAGLVVGGVAQPGYPIAAYRGTDFVRCGRGLSVNGIDIDHTAGQCQGAPKGALYLDPTGYPVEDLDSTWVLGDPNPDWTGSVRTNIRIGKLSLGGLLDIRSGGISYNGTKGALQHFGVAQITADTRNAAPVAFGTDYYPSNADQFVNPSHAVAGPGVGLKVPLDESWWTSEASVYNGVDVAFLEPGHFVKLREVSIGYTFDQRWVSKWLGFSSLEVRLAGRNAVSWNGYTGVDPETSLLGAGTVVRGIDYFNNPQAKSWVFTLTLNR
jgi:TonB-linked SusC/RagA family outer membrane protein